MAKVYLSPAYHYFNRCAVAGCDETTHNNRYLDELEPYLTACGIQWRRGPRRTPRSAEDGNLLMQRAVRESDDWGADVHYVSHTNAFDGTVRGYRPMIYPGSARGRRLAELLTARRRTIYDGPISLTERSDLYELRVPAAASYYEEHVFHDNSEDAEWFHENLRAVAEQTARGLCDYFSLPFTDPYARPEPQPEPQPVPAGDTAQVALPLLRRGDAGEAVRAAMAVLRDGGWYTLPLAAGDKVFGPEMEAAVRRLQRAAGLTVDGIVGRDTWTRLLGG